MANISYSELKKGGFMRQVQKNHFSLRLRIAGGQVGAEQLTKITEIAQKYGHGYIHLTARQSIEIPFINIDDVEVVKSELAKAGVQPGACGPRVRTVTACQGDTICPSGLIETSALAEEFDTRYYARELPHKFKFGITGCRNNCLKAEENDLGVKGGMHPIWHQKNCNYCGLCAVVCREKSIVVDKPNQTLTLDETTCNDCGRCVKACPTDAWEGKSGYLIYFGGMLGNHVCVGRQLLPIVYSKDDLFKITDATLAFFAENAKPSERFANTLDRVGWDKLEKTLKEVLS